jgi:hypothetical protein
MQRSVRQATARFRRAALLISCATLTLASCSLTASTPANVHNIWRQRIGGVLYIDVTHADAQYFREASRLNLAKDWHWPKRPLAPTFEARPQWYETGFGTQAADRYWFCSWAIEAVAAKPGSKLEWNAIRTLQQIRSLYYYRKTLTKRAGRLFSSELALSDAGRLSELRRDVRLNCPRGT